MLLVVIVAVLAILMLYVGIRVTSAAFDFFGSIFGSLTKDSMVEDFFRFPPVRKDKRR